MKPQLKRDIMKILCAAVIAAAAYLLFAWVLPSPAQADNRVNLLTLKWSIGSKVSNTEHHMQFGGIVGNTGMALATFREPSFYARRNKMTDKQKAIAVVAGLAVVALVASNSSGGDDKNCRQVKKAIPGTRHGVRFEEVCD